MPEINSSFRQAKLEEYRALKDELNHNRWKQAQVFLYCLLAAGALLGYSFSTAPSLETAYLFLSPLIVLVPSSLIIISLRNFCDRIASYIRVFLEAPDDGLMYESIVSRFIWPRIWPGIFRYYDNFAVYQAMVYSNTALVFLSIGLTLYFGWGKSEGPAIITVVLTSMGFVAAMSCLLYMFISERKFSRPNLDKAWQIARQAWRQSRGEGKIIAEPRSSSGKQYARAYKRWTGEEDARLKDKYGEGLSVRQLSEIFQRWPRAIRSRLRKLRLLE